MTPLLAFIVALSQQPPPQQAPPNMYIDQGACPGEGCAFGKWQALKTVRLHSEKQQSSKVVATLSPKEVVKAITGDVHTVAGIFVLEKPIEHTDGTPHVHQPGERVFIYTYGGEGYYSYWCRGKVGGMISPETKGQWRIGHWEREPRSTWWVKIQTKSGTIGWTSETGSDSFLGTYEGDQGYIIGTTR